jgi:DNA-directed RNA polymerase subunit RPC12/RpoP
MRMFRCDHCHTEFGGIRGLDAGTCPRCRGERARPERRDWSTRPFAASPPQRLTDAAAVAPLGLQRVSK